MDDFAGENDLLPVRIIETDNNKIYLKKTDPYGLWSLSLERGSLPESYKGFYTSADLAEHAARVYLAERNKEGKPTKS